STPRAGNLIGRKRTGSRSVAIPLGERDLLKIDFCQQRGGAGPGPAVAIRMGEGAGRGREGVSYRPREVAGRRVEDVCGPLAPVLARADVHGADPEGGALDEPGARVAGQELDPAQEPDELAPGQVADARFLAEGLADRARDRVAAGIVVGAHDE